MIVSIGIIAYNEKEYLPDLFEDILAQTYPKQKTEILLIDSMSTDDTRMQMERFKEEHPEYYGVQVLANPGKIQAAGWNVAIKNFKGEALARIDAHTKIPNNFIAENVRCLEQGEDVTGGRGLVLNKDNTNWSNTLLWAEESMFGSGIAEYRRDIGQKYVKTLFHPVYRRAVVEKVGLFDETLGRTEDNEYHYRIRRAGFQLCQDVQIYSYHYVRPSLGKMMKQKYSNGYWIGLTLGVAPGCISIFHLVPAAFMVGILSTTILAILSFPFLAYLMWGMYLLLCVIMTIETMLRHKKAGTNLLLPVIIFLLHVSYGIGTWVGIIKMPHWLSKRNKNGKLFN